MSQLYSYQLILSYRGTNYHGWQNQGEKYKSVQLILEETLASFVNYQKVQAIAASRTDTGVHAEGQLVKLILPKMIAPEKLALGLNSKLPIDIRVIELKNISNEWNVNDSVNGKKYHYYFTNHQERVPAQYADLIFNNKDSLDLNKMKTTCDFLIGEHDFKNMAQLKPGTVNAKRAITKCSIKTTSFSPSLDKVYYLEIEGAGFLKYMIRYLFAYLVEVGNGRASIESLKKLLTQDHIVPTWKKAPAHGLHLISVNTLEN